MKFITELQIPFFDSPLLEPETVSRNTISRRNVQVKNVHSLMITKWNKIWTILTHSEYYVLL